LDIIKLNKTSLGEGQFGEIALQTTTALFEAGFIEAAVIFRNTILILGF